jgi:hypothetical protein
LQAVAWTSKDHKPSSTQHHETIRTDLIQAETQIFKIITAVLHHDIQQVTHVVTWRNLSTNDGEQPSAETFTVIYSLKIWKVKLPSLAIAGVHIFMPLATQDDSI